MVSPNHTEKRRSEPERLSQARISALEHKIEHAAHYLPSQGPITAFVHHNTLHAFEHLTFDQGVLEGARIYGTEPYLQEYRYRLKYEKGRFSYDDLEKAVIDELGASADDKIGPNGSKKELWMRQLQHPCQVASSSELQWVIEESEALSHFHASIPHDQIDELITETKQWIVRDVRNGAILGAYTDILNGFPKSLKIQSMESWDSNRWQKFYLNSLWGLSIYGASTCQDNQNISHIAPQSHIRHVEIIRLTTEYDLDEWVNQVLIRFTSAFIDQDFATESLPHREKGYLSAFHNLYGKSGRFVPEWMKQGMNELNYYFKTGLSPIEIINQSLNILGVSAEDEDSFLIQTLLALRGFTGMIWQMETRGDRIAKPVPEGTLYEYLTIRLILEISALNFVKSKLTRKKAGSLSELKQSLIQSLPQPVKSIEERAYIVFQVAQLMRWKIENLSQYTPEQWRTLIYEIESVTDIARRAIYHLAFERAFRNKALQSVYSHYSQRINKTSEVNKSNDPLPTFQLVCCIDDREESFRRAVEETDSRCETFGVAGFFAVAMNYKGAADAHYTPLCPVIIKPQHKIVEEVVYSKKKEEHTKRKRRRTIGTVTYRVHLGSRTFAGGWIAAIFGSVASIPLITRILFPGPTARIMKSLGGFVRPPDQTRLKIKVDEYNKDALDSKIGYTVTEMADIVERLLRDISLIKNFSIFVIICGHGSSNMNNPHSAAYDCGACGGGKGGPNARAFAFMANNSDVRQIVKERGIPIPATTIFVGAYHNTCDDSISYYDLESIPAYRTEEFETIEKTLDVARALNAHERCRRFESAALDISPAEALRHVEARSQDLSQVRPECGHATNAICIVGHRDWSKGLFLDRRSFLQSYNSKLDTEDCQILTRILQAVIPVCGGINLEYMFSYIDSTGYGCGTKLPHNVTGLLGVMNGPLSDLRTGLPWQMVEIHEPVRLLFIIETTPEKLIKILTANPSLATLVYGYWVRVATFNPETFDIHLYQKGQFVKQHFDASPNNTSPSSMSWYRGRREHLDFATITKQI